MNQEQQTTARRNLRDLVNALGATEVLILVDNASNAVEAAEAKVELPDGFAFFRKEDWYGYADASRFEDGVRPVIGKIKMEDADGVIQESLVIIAACSDKAGNATLGALVEFTTYSNDEDDKDGSEQTERTYQAEFTTLAAALGAFALVNQAVQPILVGKLQAIFGFKKIN